MTDLWMPGAEQRPQPGGVTMNGSLPSRVTWHITWDALTNGQQPSFDGVAGYLERMGYCPHLMWDPWTGRIIQFYPADEGGRALVNWNQDGQYNIQIETFFSPGAIRDGVTYQTVADTPCVGLDEILAWTDSLGIPRTWPMGAPQWAGNSRDPGIWNTQAGHYGHCNVPDNTHSDPGPMPDLNRSGIAAQSTTITPTEQDWLDMATKEEVTAAVYEGCLQALGWAIDTDDGKKLSVFGMVGAVMPKLNRLPDDIINKPVPWFGFDGKTPTSGRTTTTLAVSAGWQDASLNSIPSAVLSHQFKLADGTVTNLAGILAQINAKPASVTNVTGTPAAIDVDGLVARLKAELPAAVLAELTSKLSQ